MVGVDWNVLVFVLLDEVGYDQEVVGEVYFDDGGEFEFQVFDVIGVGFVFGQWVFFQLCVQVFV